MRRRLAIRPLVQPVPRYSQRELREYLFVEFETDVRCGRGRAAAARRTFEIGYRWQQQFIRRKRVVRGNRWWKEPVAHNSVRAGAYRSETNNRKYHSSQYRDSVIFIFHIKIQGCENARRRSQLKKENKSSRGQRVDGRQFMRRRAGEEGQVARASARDRFHP